MAIARAQQTPPAQADMWFHIRFGQEFLGPWTVRDPGHLGQYDNASWIPTQWLAQMGMARIESLWGIAGVLWATGAICISIVGILYTVCRGSAAPLPSAIATAVGVLAAMPGLSARPQIVSYLFIVITLAAWLASARDGRPRYWLIAIAWLWPMCHGMWPIGVSISVAAGIGIALDHKRSRADRVRLATIPMTSILVAALTPIGLDAYRALMTVGSRAKYFAEWGATDFRSPPAALLAVMVVVVAVTNMRSRPVPWTTLALFAVAFAWALYSLRTTPAAALLLTPLFADALQRLVPRSQGMEWLERCAVGGVALAGLVSLSFITGGAHEARIVPSWVDSRLDAMRPGSTLLNDWDSGSYLLYRHQDIDLVMHGYGDVFTAAELERNAELVRLQPGWDELVSELDADFALLETDSALGYALKEMQGWQVVERDDEFVLLAPRQVRVQ